MSMKYKGDVGLNPSVVDDSNNVIVGALTKLFNGTGFVSNFLFAHISCESSNELSRETLE